MTFKSIEELKKEIEETNIEINDLIKGYDLKKPYHAIDIWEEKNITEAVLTQTNAIIKLIENFEIADIIKGEPTNLVPKTKLIMKMRGNKE